MYLRQNLHCGVIQHKGFSFSHAETVSLLQDDSPNTPCLQCLTNILVEILIPTV